MEKEEKKDTDIVPQIELKTMVKGLHSMPPLKLPKLEIDESATSQNKNESIEPQASPELPHET